MQSEGCESPQPFPFYVYVSSLDFFPCPDSANHRTPRKHASKSPPNCESSQNQDYAVSFKNLKRAQTELDQNSSSIFIPPREKWLQSSNLDPTSTPLHAVSNPDLSPTIFILHLTNSDRSFPLVPTTGSDSAAVGFVGHRESKQRNLVGDNDAGQALVNHCATRDPISEFNSKGYATKRRNPLTK